MELSLICGKGPQNSPVTEHCPWQVRMATESSWRRVVWVAAGGRPSRAETRRAMSCRICEAAESQAPSPKRLLTPPPWAGIVPLVRCTVGPCSIATSWGGRRHLQLPRHAVQLPRATPTARASDGQVKRSWGALKSGKVNISGPPECKPCVVRPLWEKQFPSMRVRPCGTAFREARAPGSTSDNKIARPVTLATLTCESHEAESSWCDNCFCVNARAASLVRTWPLAPL